MKERPIHFYAPEVRATMDGRKTQTRRIVNKPIPSGHKFHGWIVESTDKKRDGCAAWGIGDDALVYDLIVAKCKYGKPGDRLWVRETWQGPLFYDEIPEDWNSDKYKNPEYCHYRASGHSCDFTDADDNFVERWSPSIHMPRWASRILLEVVNVRVERLQDISEEDAIAEGVEIPSPYAGVDTEGNVIESESISRMPSDYYKDLWESINGPGSWDLNPWVWVIEFKDIKL